MSAAPTSLPLPPPPPRWRRVLAFPRALARQLLLALDLKHHRIRSAWRLRCERMRTTPSTVRRAWIQTDPHGLARLMEGYRARYADTHPPRPTPKPPGTIATYQGVLRMRGVFRGVTLHSDPDGDEPNLEIEAWLSRELGLDAAGGTEAHVAITVEVLDGPSTAAQALVPSRPAHAAAAGAVTAEEYDRLVAAGIVDRIELIEGRIVVGHWPLAFPPDETRAAARLGIRVRSCVDAVLDDEVSRREIAARIHDDAGEPGTSRG